MSPKYLLILSADILQGDTISIFLNVKNTQENKSAFYCSLKQGPWLAAIDFARPGPANGNFSNTTGVSRS